MSFENAVGMGDVCNASVVKGSGHNASFGLAGHYEVKCHNAQGELMWEDVIENKVVNTGLGLSLNGALSNTAQGAVFMGLKSVGTPLAADTQVTHASWTEIITYNLNNISGAATRATPTFSAISGQTTAISPSAVQVFYMNSSTVTNTVVAGCFVNIGGTSAFNNTTGTLFSVGDFTGGTKTVNNTDSLSVTYTATGTSA